MISTARTLATILLICLQTAILNAQPKPSLKPPRDPFLKDRGAPASAPDTSENLTIVTVVFETYALAQDDVVGLLALPPDRAARYARVNELVAAGKARLTDVEACASKSGKHGSIESVDVAYLATQYYPPLRKEDQPIAASISEVREGGHVEFDAILGPDGRTCNLNFSFVADRLSGFREYRSSARGQAQPLPNIEKRQVITSVAVRTGEPVFLGTLNPPAGTAQDGKDMLLLFGRVLVNKDRPETPMPVVGGIGYSEHVFLAYSLERAAARDVMLANLKPGAAFAAVRTLAEQKRAKLEHVFSLPSQAGVQVKSDENIISAQPGGSSQVVKLAEITPVRDEAGKPQAPETFPYIPTVSGKNLGLSVEFESVVGPRDALLKGLPLAAEVNLSLSWRADLGNFKTVPAMYPETGAAESRHLQNALTCYVGVPTLLGTLNPPHDTGINERKDSGRTWLVFVQVVPVKP